MEPMTGTAVDVLQVLLVDDNGTNLEVYKKILRQIPNVECVAYMMPEDALHWAAAHDPDLIIVDYEMPKLNGLEFIERFRMFRARTMTPIVMLTGAQEKDVRLKALELGATDFLAKPADPVEFLARVRNLLSMRHGHKKLADHAASLAEELKKATAQVGDAPRIVRCSCDMRGCPAPSHSQRDARCATTGTINTGLQGWSERAYANAYLLLCPECAK